MKSGFTLVELVVVVLILGVLAFIAIPRVSRMSNDAQETACTANLDLMDHAIETYFGREEAYPGDLSDVTEDVDYFPEGTPKCPLEGDYSMNSNKRTSCSHASGGGCGW